MSLNVLNRTIFHEDNIYILRGLNSLSVDLIYLDPPFNKNDTFINSNNPRVKEIKQFFVDLQKQGQFKGVDFGAIFQDDSAAFSDIWNKNDINEEYYKQIDDYDSRLIIAIDSIKDYAPAGGFYYLIYMTIRLIEMKRILKETGALYLHCDPTFSHYLKSILDLIFGVDNFRNEIVWGYDTAGRTTRHWNRKHDNILYYAKSPKHNMNQMRIERQNLTEDWKSWYPLKDKDGRRYQIDGKGYKYYADAKRLMNDWWTDIRALHSNRDKERTGYPTQKPLALLERIIKVSSSPGDVVLDPFCGCATTCLAAEKLGRQWIGIDKNPQTYYMIYYRAYQSDLLGVEGKPSVLHNNLKQTSQIPKRSDMSAREKKLLQQRKEALKEAQVLKGKKDSRVKLSTKEREIAKNILYGQQAGICAGCDVYMQSANLTIDHIVPQSYGGDDDLGNLQLLCHRDNIFKGNKPMQELLEKLLADRLISQPTYDKQCKYWQNYTRKNQKYKLFAQASHSKQAVIIPQN